MDSDEQLVKDSGKGLITHLTTEYAGLDRNGLG